MWRVYPFEYVRLEIWECIGECTDRSPIVDVAAIPFISRYYL